MNKPDNHRDPRLLITTLLALSTGLAILLVAESLRIPMPTRSADQVASRSVETAHRFYGAVDHLLETGDATPLNAVTVFDVQSHGEIASDVGGRAVLINSLVRLRNLVPGVRLTVNWAAASSGGRVSVGLRTHATETATFAGLDVPVEARSGGWGPVEEIRIEDGRVVERWAGSADAYRFDELARVAVEALPEPSTRVMALVRLTLPPRSHVSLVNGGTHRVLVIEEGRIGITDDSTRWADTVPDLTDGAPSDRATPVTRPDQSEYASADTLVTGPAERLTITAVGERTARVLVWARYAKRLGAASQDIARSVAEEGETATIDASSAGVEVDTLGVGIADFGRGSVVSLGRVTMSTGSTLTWPNVRASCVVLADAEDIAVTSDPVTSGLNSSPGHRSADRAAVDASSTLVGDTMGWHAAQGSSVLVMTVLAGAVEATSPVPSDG